MEQPAHKEGLSTLSINFAKEMGERAAEKVASLQEEWPWDIVKNRKRRRAEASEQRKAARKQRAR